MGTATTPWSQQPHSAAIHSGRFSDQKITASPLVRPACGEPRAKGQRGAAHLRIGEGPAPKAVVVGKKRPAQRGQVVKEVEQRVTSHALTYHTS